METNELFFLVQVSSETYQETKNRARIHYEGGRSSIATDVNPVTRCVYWGTLTIRGGSQCCI